MAAQTACEQRENHEGWKIAGRYFQGTLITTVYSFQFKTNIVNTFTLSYHNSKSLSAVFALFIRTHVYSKGRKGMATIVLLHSTFTLIENITNGCQIQLYACVAQCIFSVSSRGCLVLPIDNYNLLDFDRTNQFQH